MLGDNGARVILGDKGHVMLSDDWDKCGFTRGRVADCGSIVQKGAHTRESWGR